MSFPILERRDLLIDRRCVAVSVFALTAGEYSALALAFAPPIDQTLPIYGSARQEGARSAADLVSVVAGKGERGGGGEFAVASTPLHAEEYGGAWGIYIVGGQNLGSSETWPSTPVHHSQTKRAEERHSCFRIHNS